MNHLRLRSLSRQQHVFTAHTAARQAGYNDARLDRPIDPAFSDDADILIANNYAKGRLLAVKLRAAGAKVPAWHAATQTPSVIKSLSRLATDAARRRGEDPSLLPGEAQEPDPGLRFSYPAGKGRHHWLLRPVPTTAET